MKYSLSAALAAALAAQNVAAHATFQELWVDGVDYDSQCARLPLSNSPVQDVTSNDMACNAGTSPVASKCPVTAGSTVTVEMHQQPGDRSCANEAIGGAHYGPVLVYMAAVADAATAEGADAAWFKVFQDTWASNGTSGSDDSWGTKDLNTCCGLMDVRIPADLAPGDYLLRAEAVALHAAGSAGGAQFYMTCYQLTVAGAGAAAAAAAPDTVSIPGAYDAADPGVLINIYQTLTAYEAPGPTVYAGGSTRSAGAPCANCESTCTAGAGSTGVAAAGGGAAAATPGTSGAATTATPASSGAATTTSAPQEVVAAAPTPSPSSSSSSSAPPAAATTSKSSCKKRRSRLARNL